MSDPTGPTLPTAARPGPDAGLREGHTDGLGNFSRIRQDDSAGAELAGGLSEPVVPSTPSGPDPFDLDQAYPQGAELAGRIDRASWRD
jgi:hypothetical protein